ncbi:uncharacterized protein C8R40DRAFT_1178876 [Lentinula edodes]|uniref:uncharacterized protein n=1 Tax=Lentinula edodes TaxID=5353 RepID=UPI001E8D4707|nr:uncharacterized protein C8R40DRAFT_1178876 [Lentinula edodes]KAH7867649.1 hypothetical protein C8R40DRAFT_1178876 [Lentinula edodes]
MSSFPSLQTLQTLRSAPHLPDTATQKTIDILYMHPDFQFPLIQPIVVPWFPSPLPAGHGGWTLRLHEILIGSPYIPPNSTVTLGTFLNIDNGGAAHETMCITSCNNPPWNLVPACSVASTCVRSLTT